MTANQIDRVPDNNNHYYHLNLQVTEQTDLPGAGNGVIIIRGVPRGTILGLYLNHPNLPRVTKDRIYNPTNTSLYAVEFNGLYRDAYDPITQNISSLVARFNDPLDVSLDNSEFFIHKDKSHLLTVRATKDIDSGSFGFLPYGGPFWCNAAYPLDLLVRAVKRYSINIYTDFYRFFTSMVGQRRISISPLVGGIWKWELVLIIWWNYLYQWLKFHWKITGGSKYQKIEMPRRSDLPRSTYLHNTFIGNRKTGALGVIIIYGSLGTLKDRWNIWTFGI
jgi:hypothetical protein